MGGLIVAGTAAGTSIGRRFAGGWIVPILSVLAFLLAFAGSLSMMASLPMSAQRIAVALLVAGALYLLSHLFRALRLAVVAAPMLGLSYRTTVSLHLFVAPWSLLMPFKLDELVRLNELRKASRSLMRSVIVLLIDRSMDGVALVILSLIALSYGQSQSVLMITILGLGLFALAFALFAAPPLLGAIQTYVFANHYRDRAFVVLRAVSNARTILVTSRGAIAGVSLFLAFVTILIWLLEYGAIAAAAWVLGAPSAPLDRLTAMLQRAETGWRLLVLHRPLPPLSVLTTIAFLYPLLLVWPLFAILYRRRLPFEPLRPRLADERPARLQEPRR